jgi:hypothetical protein
MREKGEIDASVKGLMERGLQSRVVVYAANVRVRLSFHFERVRTLRNVVNLLRMNFINTCFDFS